MVSTKDFFQAKLLYSFCPCTQNITYSGKWLMAPNHSVCPRSDAPFYIVTYYIKWVTTSRTHRMMMLDSYSGCFIIVEPFLGSKKCCTSKKFCQWTGLLCIQCYETVSATLHVRMVGCCTLGYLVLYNSVQTLGWTLLLAQMLMHFAQGTYLLYAQEVLTNFI